jgi:hypothetical protein
MQAPRIEILKVKLLFYAREKVLSEALNARCVPSAKGPRMPWVQLYAMLLAVGDIKVLELPICPL